MKKLIAVSSLLIFLTACQSEPDIDLNPDRFQSDGYSERGAESLNLVPSE